MRRDYVVLSVDASITEACVRVTLLEQEALEADPRRDQDWFGTSRDRSCSSMRMSMSEYKQSKVSVGDSVSLELTKIDGCRNILERKDVSGPRRLQEFY